MRGKSCIKVKALCLGRGESYRPREGYELHPSVYQDYYQSGWFVIVPVRGICANHRFQAVGNYNNGSALNKTADRLLDLGLIFGIKG